ncbi:MAG: hypothetical protein V2I67_03935 [Thermoanaerobaculales bacterium]|nr:hypothetical protein [Thermoanaerobaculales bacterium]
MFESRVTVLVGHFGSGKTEIALSSAMELAGENVPVTMADLDVVKPYFRSRSARAILAEAGIELLAPGGEHVHADLPIVVPQIRSQLRQSERRIIIDVGGDDVGARVLGSLADVVPPDETECLLVLNFRRPSTPDPAGAVTMVRGIEAVSRLPVAGLISNTHLMDETTADVIMDGLEQALETGEKLNVPVRAVAAAGLVADEVEAMTALPVIRLRRIVAPPFDVPRQRTTGPLFVVN